MSVEPVTGRLGVSIIIPSYNYERFVGAAIDSALAQTHAPVEVIVVDDGSTDGSRTVIEAYGDRITAIFQPNAGHLVACLRGYEVARQDIVVFLDSDDILLPEAAATIVANWQPGLAKLQFQMETIDAAGRGDGHIWPKFPATLEPEEVKSELLRTGAYPAPPTSGNAYSRQLLEASRPHGGHRYVDSLLNTIAPLYGEVRTLRQPLTRYRVHGNNSWAQNVITADRFAYYAASERLRMEVLATHCARCGIAFDGARVIERSVYYREVELARRKLQTCSLVNDLALLAEGWRSARAALAHPHGPWHKVLRGAWSMAVALAPQPMASRLIAMRFVQGARPRFAERLINVFSARRKVGDDTPGPGLTPLQSPYAPFDPVAARIGET